MSIKHTQDSLLEGQSSCTKQEDGNTIAAAANPRRMGFLAIVSLSCFIGVIIENPYIIILVLLTSLCIAVIDELKGNPYLILGTLMVSNIIALSYMTQGRGYVIAFRHIAYGIAAFSAFLYIALKRWRSSSNPHGLMILFVAWIIMSSLFSINPSKSLEYLLWLIATFFFIFVYMDAVSTSRDIVNILSALFIPCLMSVVIGLLGVAGIGELAIPRGIVVAIRGVFATTNYYGVIAAVVILISLLSIDIESRPKALYVVSFILGLIGLLLSNARGAWVGVAIGMMLYSTFRKGIVRRLSIVLLFILIIIYFLNPIFFYTAARIDESKVYGTFGERTLLWEYAYRSIPEIPITGLGMGNMEEIYGNIQTVLPANFPTELYGYSFHNAYLQIAIETGLLGLLLFLLIISLSIYKTVVNIRKGQRDEDRVIILVAFLSIIVCLLTNAFFESTLLTPGGPVFLIFWVVLALLPMIKITSKDNTDGSCS